MTLPTPGDMGRAPLWENYIIAQVVQASLGLIPEHALAISVAVAGTDVQLRFQLSQLTEADETDISDIISTLEALVGSGVRLEATHRVVTQREVSPLTGECWTFLSRT